jgi:hypothetical protein
MSVNIPIVLLCPFVLAIVLPSFLPSFLANHKKTRPYERVDICNFSEQLDSVSHHRMIYLDVSLSYSKTFMPNQLHQHTH